MPSAVRRSLVSVIASRLASIVRDKVRSAERLDILGLFAQVMRADLEFQALARGHGHLAANDPRYPDGERRE
jgi:hypothetical protein